MGTNWATTTTCGAALTLAFIMAFAVAEQPTFTFLHPGTSFVEYRPQWTDVQQLVIKFSFRTLEANTLLLHHTLLEVAGDYRPEITVRLKRGMLQVSHNYQEFDEVTTVAKGLNHNKWHHVTVTLDINTHHLFAQVDDRGSSSITLKAFVDNKLKPAYSHGKRTSIVSVGGFNPNNMAQPGKFVGCVKAVHFLDGTRVVPTAVYSQADVEDGCLDVCEQDNPCQNNGRCVNEFTRTQCDCFDTDHEGEHCEKEGLSAVTLHGGEWITYTVYEDDEAEKSHSPANRIALQFKTGSSSGILFYARDQFPQYNHLALSVFNGSLHVSVVFEDRDSHNELFLSMGQRLDNSRWHSVVVEHQGKEVIVTLDSDQEHMEADYEHPHLHMPSTVYYGGLDEVSQAAGLKSTNNFAGCLRGLYFNEVSVLEALPSGRAVANGPNGPGSLQHECKDLRTTTIQFPVDGAFAKLEHPEGQILDLDLEFRTLKPDGLLAHTDISSSSYKGYVKVVLVKGRLEVRIVPSSFQSDNRQVLELGEAMNDGSWHSVRVVLQSGLAQMQVDKKLKVLSLKWFLNIGSATYIGFSPDITEMKNGFIGCMHNIRVQDMEIDPLDLVNSDLSVGLSLGSCDLIDWCVAVDNPCLHGALCVSEWSGSYCDCSEVKYHGNFCQFATLRRSCEDYYLAGEERSGAWQIDIDDGGPTRPTYVTCDMGKLLNGRRYGVTLVEHNLKPKTNVRNHNKYVDMKKVLSYRDMGKDTLVSFTEASEFCRQKVEVGCKRALLGMGKETWLSSATGEVFSALGGDTEKACACHEQNTCIDKRYACNCDQRSGHWVTDGGYINNPDHVPVTEMTFLQVNGGQAHVTLGDLECMGVAGGSDAGTVTFTTTGSYVRLPGWRGGDLEFLFRTLSSEAILAYQHGRNTSYQDVQLVIAVTGANKLFLRSSSPALHEVVETTRPLNTGEWLRIRLEFSLGQLRLDVAGQRFLYDLPAESTVLGDQATELHLGGKPIMGPDSLPGVVGCMGGVSYNDKVHNLSDLADELNGVLVGCDSHCDSNPCQFGGKCLEQWTSYTCQCANTDAHSGQDCQFNINTNAVKFVASEYYLQFEELPDTGLLTNDVIFSFRTTQTDALLLYIHDQVNNFLQVAVRSGNEVAVSYNDGKDIKTGSLAMEGLTDGSWKQASWRKTVDGRLELIVEGKSLKMDERTSMLTEYIQVPFPAGETVVPMRTLSGPPAGYQVYVGGVPSGFTNLGGLKGCFRGLKVGNKLFDLDAEARQKEGMLEGCPSGCEQMPCHNLGRCLDDIDFNGLYTCDCVGTGFAGPYCNSEVGNFFSGKTTVLENLRKASDDVTGLGYEAHIELNFATSSTVITKRVIAFARGMTGLSDYMLVYLTEDSRVAAKMQIQSTTITLEDSEPKADGKPHFVSLTRSGDEISLKVDEGDGEAYQLKDNETVAMDPPAMLYLAYARKDNWRFLDYANFSGDMWNVFFTSDLLGVANARPLEVSTGYDDGNNGVSIEGVLGTATQSLYGIRSGERKDTTTEAEHVTLPPWNPGQARTVNLVDPSAQTEEEEDKGVSPAVAFVICFVTLSVFGGGIAFVVIRHRRKKKKGKYSPADFQPAGDEEEGLLEIKETAANSNHDGMPTAKPRQGPKKNKQGGGSDEENEETPMLQQEAPLSVTTAPGQAIEMDSFDKDGKPFDDAEEGAEDNSSILRPKKPARTHETTTGSLVLEEDSPGLDLPREVLTESQVIEMMDKEDSEEGREASWSPSDLEHTVPVVPAELQKQGADKSLDAPVRPESQDGAVAPDTQAAKAAEGAEDAGDAKEPDTAQSGKSDAAKAGSSSPADDDSEGDEAATQRDIQVTAEVYTPPEATPSGQKGSNAGGDESEARQEPEVDGTPAEAVRSESADASQQQSSGQASTLDTQVSLSDASETDSTPSEVPVDDVKPAVTPPLPEGDAPPVPERSAKKENEVKH